jgi:predicted anti-sigma-YlaC factor YlaD
VSRRRFIIDCREAHVLLSERLDRPIDRYDRARLRLHLLICRWCSRIERHFDFIARAVRRLER